MFRVHDERHRLELTARYGLVRQHAATDFEQAEAGDGADLPQFVKDALDAVFEWDILARRVLLL